MSHNLPTSGDQGSQSHGRSPAYFTESGESDPNFKKIAKGVVAAYEAFGGLIPEVIRWGAIRNALDMQYHTGTMSDEADVYVPSSHIKEVINILTSAASEFTPLFVEGSPKRDLFTHGDNPRIFLRIFDDTYYQIDLTNRLKWTLNKSVYIPLVGLYLRACLEIYTHDEPVKHHIRRLIKHRAVGGFDETELNKFWGIMHEEKK